MQGETRLARSSTSFKPGQSGGGSRKGVPNKLTCDQRQIFDLAISPEDRVQMVKTAFARAMSNDDQASSYMKMLFDFVFSRPKIGHEVAVLNMSEVFTPEVMDSVWKEVLAEAVERGRQQGQTPLLSIIDAQVVEEVKGNGRQKRNGQARNGRKKKNGKTRKG